MGIHYFFGSWVSKLGNSVNVRRLPSGVEGMIFDLNSLLHHIAQITYLYGDARKKLGGDFNAHRDEALKETPKNLLDTYVTNLTVELNSILDSVSPSQYLILAVDGVAPGAKISQQRSRRYKDAAIVSGSDDVVIDRPIGGFTSALISPGTKFMEAIDTSIKSWISRSVNSRNLPPVIYYSSHQIPGEGEHKAFTALRNFYNEGTISQGKGAHVVYGMDSDLMVIGLLSPIRNIYMMRDANENISIDALFGEIKQTMTAGGKAVSNTFSDDVLRRDFAVVVMMVGNDFLPNMLGFNRVVPILFEAYASINSPLTRENSDGEVEIILSSLGNFLNAVAQRENLAEVALEELNAIGTRFERIKRTAALEAGYDPVKKTVNMDKVRSVWYTDAARMRNIAVISGIGPIEGAPTATEVIENMVCQYIAGMAWVMRYYTIGGGGINWLYSYKFHTAPLIGDVATMIFRRFSEILPPARRNEATARSFVFDFCDGVGISEKDGDPLGRGKSAISPVHQLLSITPPSRAEVTIGVVKLSNLLLIGGSLSNIAPNQGEYEIYSDGKAKDYMAIPILPEVDLLNVVEAVERADQENHDAKISTFRSPAAVAKRAKELADAEGEILDKKGNVKRQRTQPMFTSIVPKRLLTDRSIRPVIIKPSARALLERARSRKDLETVGRIGRAADIVTSKPSVVKFLKSDAAGQGDFGGVGRWGVFSIGEGGDGGSSSRGEGSECVGGGATIDANTEKRLIDVETIREQLK